MKYFTIVLFLCFSISTITSQVTLHGKVIDAQTKEPLAFANLFSTDLKTSRSLTDVDGQFSIMLKDKSHIISCSFVGYKTKNFQISGDASVFQVFEMHQMETTLDEVTITPANNPANAIIRKAIKNKEHNNPESLQSFTYNAYNKMVYQYKSGKAKTDSVEVNKMLKNGHLFIMESVTERKFLYPDFTEERIVGNKVSGFTNPAFAMLATDIQPFSFYGDNIRLFDIQYLNPVSKGSLSKYKFRIKDTIVNEKDTTFVISFKPLAKKNFEGLQGLLYINSNHYAIQNVIASPFARQKIDIKIQQQYTLIDNQYWFPSQLNFVLTINELKQQKIVIDGKSYISNVSINTPMRKRDFALQSVIIEKNAGMADSTFWKQNRNQPLTITEENTYRVIDSIGKKRHFDKYVNVMQAVVQNRFPFKYFDIDLSKTFLYNEYEGTRLGSGLYTNDKISKRFVAGVFAGYGIKDERLKYGAEIIFDIHQKTELRVLFRHQDNYVEAGNYGMRSQENDFLNYRRFLGFQFDRIQQQTAGIQGRVFKYLQFSVSANKTLATPQYHFNALEAEFLPSYDDSKIDICLRFAYKEKIVSLFQKNASVGSKYPIITVFFSKGLPNILDGDLVYNKWEAKITQSFFTKNFGKTTYTLEGGFIDRPIPYGLLFTGQGSASNNSLFLTKDYFQTMRLYEFVSDQFANIFLSHNFGGLLFKSGNFQPSVTLHNNVGWGDLSLQNRFANGKTKEKLFSEAGLQLDNLIKMNYLNIGNIGFGTAAFCRYGAYAKNTLKDNLYFKFTLNFTIK